MKKFFQKWVFLNSFVDKGMGSFLKNMGKVLY